MGKIEDGKECPSVQIAPAMIIYSFAANRCVVESQWKIFLRWQVLTISPTSNAAVDGLKSDNKYIFTICPHLSKF